MEHFWQIKTLTGLKRLVQWGSEQAMITLQGMAEHRFSNLYDYQCLTLELYLYGRIYQKLWDLVVTSIENHQIIYLLWYYSIYLSTNILCFSFLFWKIIPCRIWTRVLPVRSRWHTNVPPCFLTIIHYSDPYCNWINSSLDSCKLL